MKIRLFFTLFLIFTSSLFADTNGIYDIRGSSSLLDSNLTQFLDKWRYETIAPVQNGTYKNVFVNGGTTQKTVALTFDDSPDENNTDKVLDVLSRYNVKASFFMIASPMNDANATIVTRASNEGHLVLGHCFTHPRLTNLTPEAITQQLNTTSERIEALTGKYPILYRPPYGSINQSVVDTVNTNGFSTVLWSLDSLDWAIKDSNAIVDNVITHIRDGDIILMHSSQANAATVQALPEIIEKLHTLGYTFLKVDEMLGLKAYKQ